MPENLNVPHLVNVQNASGQQAMKDATVRMASRRSSGVQTVAERLQERQSGPNNIHL